MSEHPLHDLQLILRLVPPAALLRDFKALLLPASSVWQTAEFFPPLALASLTAGVYLYSTIRAGRTVQHSSALKLQAIARLQVSALGGLLDLPKASSHFRVINQKRFRIRPSPCTDYIIRLHVS